MGRGLADSIVPPAVWHGEASISARNHLADPALLSPCPGHPSAAAYTPAVRRWVCIVAMLAGFSGGGYAWTARPRIAAPIVRVLDLRRPDPGLPEVAWWNLS